MKRLMFITVICAFVSAPAFADLVAISDPVPGNSWSVQFAEGGIGTFDLIAVRMVSPGDAFETESHSGFNQAGWSLLYENSTPYPTIASASGPDVTSMTYWYKFQGVSSNSLTFDYVAMDGDTIRLAQRTWWSGSAWSYQFFKPQDSTLQNAFWLPTRAEVVPLPGAILLGLLGLSAAGIKLRKFA